MGKCAIDQTFVLANTLITKIHYLKTTESTNDFAKKLSNESDLDLPLLVITDNQTKGRGQKSKTWWSGEGSLTHSVIINNATVSNPLLLPAAVANSVVEAISDFFHDQIHAKIKWPNDIFIGRKKIAGILIESQVPSHNIRVVVVGIGINSNCRMAEAPDEIIEQSTSILDLTGQKTDHSKLLVNLLNRLFLNIENLNRCPLSLLKTYTANTVLGRNSEIKIQLPDNSIRTGIFAGFGSQGELLINDNSGPVSIVSGSIVEFMPNTG